MHRGIGYQNITIAVCDVDHKTQVGKKAVSIGAICSKEIREARFFDVKDFGNLPFTAKLSITENHSNESLQQKQQKKKVSMEPLSNDLIEFLKTCRIKVTDKLTVAFNEIGIEEMEDLDELNEGITAALEDAMKPIEKIKFRKGLVGREQKQKN